MNVSNIHPRQRNVNKKILFCFVFLFCKRVVFKFNIIKVNITLNNCVLYILIPNDKIYSYRSTSK